MRIPHASRSGICHPGSLYNRLHPVRVGGPRLFKQRIRPPKRRKRLVYAARHDAGLGFLPRLLGPLEQRPRGHVPGPRPLFAKPYFLSKPVPQELGDLTSQTVAHRQEVTGRLLEARPFIVRPARTVDQPNGDVVAIAVSSTSPRTRVPTLRARATLSGGTSG